MRSTRLISALVLLGLLAAGLPLTATASPAGAPQAQTNLIKNASFEEGFSNGVANQWAAWWLPGSGCDRTTPTYREANTTIDARRVKDGSRAQQLLVDPGLTYYGGLQQTVSGLTAGKTYRFTIWAQAWSSSGDDPAKSEGTNAINFRIGIGQGTTYAADTNIKWSDYNNAKDTYAQLAVEAVASGNSLTLFTMANPAACIKHNETFWDAASLTEGAAAPANTAAPTQPPAPTLRVIPTKFPTPTPNAEGKIIYTVQPGNTIIDICGVIGRGSDPSCVDDILKWNGISNPKGIYVGQQLIIGQTGAPPPPTATTPPTEVPAATEAGGQPTTDPNAQPTTDPNAQPTTDPNAQPTAAVGQPTEAAGGQASICVTLYNDANGNGVYDGAGEGLVAGGAFSLLDVGNSNTVATYTTDGASEPHCFENLPGGNYRITSTAPGDYKATTRSDWDLTLAAGSTANLEFGAQSTGSGGTAGNGDSGGSADNTSRLVRALLAAAGVVLLLIAAGVAGFLVLTRRR